jgi:nucleoside-diphosphate-sugar epimerase
LIVDGTGLLGTAFRTHGDPSVPGFVFARGVSDSGSANEGDYRREHEVLLAAIKSASQAGEPIVYFCGAPIYGAVGSPRRENDEVHPRTRYGRHQLEMERAIVTSTARHLIIRTANVVGPGGHANQLIPALVRQVSAGSVVVQRGASRDLLDVEDLVDVTQRLLRVGADSVVNVATGSSTPVDAIVHRIAEILGVEPDISPGPEGEVQQFDISRLTGLIGPLQFGPAYPFDVLDRYVPGLAATPSSVQAVRRRR